MLAVAELDEPETMKLSFRLLLPVALVASTGVPAAAQQILPPVTQFDDATVSRLLLDGQATWRIEGGPDGRAVYRVSAQDGINFTVQPQACTADQGCASLLVIATFPARDGVDLLKLDRLLSRFNDVNATAKVYRTSDGTVLLQAYINAAFGISYANAQAQLLIFGRNLQALRAELMAPK